MGSLPLDPINTQFRFRSGRPLNPCLATAPPRSKAAACVLSVCPRVPRHTKGTSSLIHCLMRGSLILWTFLATDGESDGTESHVVLLVPGQPTPEGEWVFQKKG